MSARHSHHGPNEVRAFPQKRYIERRHWIDGVKIAAGCKDCGVNGPAEVLTFGAPWEYEGCDLVTLCEGCHARITKLRARAMELFGQFNVYELPIVIATVERMLTAQPEPAEPPKDEEPAEDRGDDPMTDTRLGLRHWILEQVDADRIALGLIA